MTRIVHVSESLATGVLSVLSILTHAQTRDGHEVTLLGSSLREDTPSSWREMLPESLNFVEVPMLREISPVADARGLFELFRALRVCRPDVVHLHSSKAGALGRIAAFPLNARVVYQPHGVAYLRNDVSPRTRDTYRFMERMLAMLGGTVIACSDGERAALAAVVGASRSAVVPNGIDLSTVLPATGSGPRIRVGTCGRISPQKGPSFFAEVARGLHGAADFVWIGDGDPEGKIALQNAGADVTGWCTRAEAQRHIAGLHVYVQTSAWEGMPISVIEAMAAGLPVVATDIVGNRDLLANSNAGYLVRTPAEMIAALAALIADGAHREQTGAAARELAEERFSAERMVKEMYGVYGIAGNNAASRGASASVERRPWRFTSLLPG